MNNQINKHSEDHRPRQSEPTPHAEDCSRPVGQYFPYDFPAGMDGIGEYVSAKFQPGLDVRSEIFL